MAAGAMVCLVRIIAASSGALSPCLRQHDIEHLDDESLFALGQACDAFELLLEFGRGSAFGGFGLFSDQILYGDGEGMRQGWQCRNRNPPATDLVGSHDLLGHADGLGELALGHGVVFAQLGDAFAEAAEEDLLVLGHREGWKHCVVGHTVPPVYVLGVDTTP